MEFIKNIMKMETLKLNIIVNDKKEGIYIKYRSN